MKKIIKMHVLNKTANGPQPYKSYVNNSFQRDLPLPNLGFGYPSEIQHMVHQHWRGFPQPEFYYSVLFYIGYIVLMFTSLFGNGLVIWIFSTSKNLRTPSNLLIINLAVFDLVMCANMPHYLLNAAVGFIVGGELGCDIYAMFGGISGMGGAISNAFIAYDRFRTISNPIDGRLNYAQIVFLLCLSWLWTVPFSVLPFFRILGRYMPEGFLTTCSYDYLTDTYETRYFICSIFVWAYVIPMVVICSNYGRLFFHVRDHERMLAEQAKKMNVKSLSSNANQSERNVEMRIAKASLIIYLLYLMAWTPYATVSLLGILNHSELITPFVSMLPASMSKMVSCLDPWVYACSHPKYRLELERRLPWLGVHEKKGVTRGTGSANECETSTMTVLDA